MITTMTPTPTLGYPLQSLAVEWACIGSAQTLATWQQIAWDEQGKITAITPISPNNQALRKIAKGKLALPGFVNAHAHLDLSTRTPIPLLPTETMGDWLLKVVTQTKILPSNPAEHSITTGIQEALSSGTTTIVSTSQALCHAITATHTAPLIRCLWLLEWFHPNKVVSTEKLRLLIDALTTATHFLRTLPDATRKHSIQLGISPHSPYNVSPQAWQALKQHLLLPDFSHLAWQTHLLESTAEVAYYQTVSAQHTLENSIDTVHQTLLGSTFQPDLPFPKDIVASLASFDLLQPTLSVVHGLELATHQADQLAKTGVALVTCPRSNNFLHSKILNEAFLHNTNLTLAVGTDAHVSLPYPTVLDLRLELQALKHAYPSLTWARLLLMATLNGAKAICMAGQVGELTLGAWADITLWHLPPSPQPTMATLEQLLATVLNSTNKPQQVIVGGQVSIG